MNSPVAGAVRAARAASARGRRRTLQGMTDHDTDPRVIIPEAEKYNATLVKREDDNDSLARFWVRPDGDAAHFEPGQYMTIGVYADEKLYQRPYSVASAPEATGEVGYEFYVRLVPILRFTTLLWRLPVGHQMRMIGPKGRFMLEPDDDRTHLFVSTGTGIAPFIAMSRQLLAGGRPRKTVMLHGCSYQDELGYRDLLEGWQRDGRLLVPRAAHGRRSRADCRSFRQRCVGNRTEVGCRLVAISLRDGFQLQHCHTTRCGRQSLRLVGREPRLRSAGLGAKWEYVCCQ